MTQSDGTLENVLTANEVAKQFHVSPRTVERWIQKGLTAYKATDLQVAQLLMAQRIGGFPPQGVWVIPQAALAGISKIRNTVGYPKGRPRKKHG